MSTLYSQPGPRENSDPQGDGVSTPVPPPAPVFTDSSGEAAYHVQVRVEKYRPGREPVGPPDEVVERAYWVDLRSGREITDPVRVAHLEEKRRRAADERVP